jgi:hypothetical protein
VEATEIMAVDLKPTTLSVKLQVACCDTFFRAGGRKAMTTQLDLAVVKLFCTAGISLNIASSAEWRNLFAIMAPSYKLALQTCLIDDHIMGTQEWVQKLQIEHLKTQDMLICSFDRGSTQVGKVVYMVHATTQDQCVMLLEVQECTKVSHTGQWVADCENRTQEAQKCEHKNDHNS